MMSLFLLCYIAIYGGAHAYLMTRTVRAFHLSAPYPLVFTPLSIGMVAAPILVRVLERYALERPARFVADVGYFWMGFFFLFLSATVALDVVRGLLALAGWLTQRDLSISPAHLVSFSALVALLACIYGLFEARRIRIEQVTLKSPKLPPTVERVRIVQLSDVHLGLMVGHERLRKIIATVEELKPDLLFSTGDLVDGQRDGLRGMDEKLAAVNAPLGKFAVTGNHEAIAGLEPSLKFIQQGGFRMLREESVAVGDHITVAGVEDPMAVRGHKGHSDHLLLKNLPRERYTILLKHRPSIEAEAAGMFDLQLSGHVHKGQIFPFNLLTHLVYPLRMGLSALPGGAFVYVSRGTGTWGPPIRVLAPPEITVIDLYPSSSEK